VFQVGSNPLVGCRKTFQHTWQRKSSEGFSTRQQGSTTGVAALEEAAAIDIGVGDGRVMVVS